MKADWLSHAKQSASNINDNDYNDIVEVASMNDDSFLFTECDGDILHDNNKGNVAHYIDEYSNMEPHFRRYLERLPKSRVQSSGTKVGSCEVIKQNGRFIFSLITQKYHKNKPSLQKLDNSFKQAFVQEWMVTCANATFERACLAERFSTFVDARATRRDSQHLCA